MSMQLPLAPSLNLDRLLRRLLGLVLGGLFVMAGFEKIIHSFDFVKAIMAYRLLPANLAGVTAAVLPWVELVTGLMLILGFKRRSCLLLLSLLLAGFMVVILITMARGLQIDCGCGLFRREVGLVALLEDGVFLAWAAGLYWWELTGISLLPGPTRKSPAS